LIFNAFTIWKRGIECMDRRKSFRIIAVLLAVGMMQAYAQLCFAQPASLAAATFPPPQLLARLTTKGNQPISVNGASVSSGESIANEAIIETPANVDATVDLGPLGSLDIEPGTKIKLEYDGNCLGAQDPGLQKCSVKVTVYAGCVTAHYKQGSYFKAVTQQEVLLGDSDKSRKNAGTFKICAGGVGAPAGAAAGTGGLSNTAKVAIAALLIGGGGGIILWALPNNSSNSTP
jgi:hypothetical protein